MSENDKKEPPEQQHSTNNGVHEQASSTQQNAESIKREETATDQWTHGAEVSESPAKSKTVVDELIESQNQPRQSTQWERDVLNRLAFATVNEQRRTRRWGIFFKVLTFVYIGAILFYVPGDWGSASISGEHVALIEVNGVIAPDTDASADRLVTGLRAAFKDKDTKAVILRINSPGGSPVQAGYVNDEIIRLRKKHEDIKVYAVIVDVCASGGYYIAAAADEIYADKASLVGSIGVLMNGFGFVGAMDKIGVERRLLTAGKNKAMMDPFSPLKASDKRHFQKMLDGIHNQFIEVVKQGRGDRLKDDPDIFSGLVWNGDESIKLGLVDGIGSSSYVAREIVGVENIVDFTPKTNFLDRFAERVGVSIAGILVETFGLQAGNLR